MTSYEICVIMHGSNRDEIVPRCLEEGRAEGLLDVCYVGLQELVSHRGGLWL